jgi:hypothetical protein
MLAHLWNMENVLGIFLFASGRGENRDFSDFCAQRTPAVREQQKSEKAQFAARTHAKAGVMTTRMR